MDVVASGVLTRGEVWLVNLDPAVGSEIRKTRPCAIVSPDAIHNNVRTVLIVPLASSSRPAPARVAVQFAGVDGFIMLEHVRAVDRSRLIKRLGALDPGALSRTLKTLQILFTE